MSHRPGSICNNILLRAERENVPINEIALQKILYFTASLYKRRTGEDLVSERFEAWQYGPVLRSVYYEFNQFKGKAITAYATYAGQAKMVREETDPALRSALDTIWSGARKVSPRILVEITHIDGTPWSKAWDTEQAYLDPELIAQDRSYDNFLEV